MFKDFLRNLSKNAISLFGVWLTSVSAVIFFSLFGFELVGYSGTPYLGIMAFLVVPAFARAITAGFIRREEQALSAAFGPAYAEYCRRVGRWL